MKPRRLELDHLAASRRSRWPGLILLAISIMAAGGIAHRYQEAQLTLQRHLGTQGLLNLQRSPARTIPKNRLDEQVKDAEGVIRQLTLPWARLIETLEDAGSSDIAILQLQPDSQQRVLRITGEARTQEAMVEYLRRLSDAKGFTRVHLLSHQVQYEDPQRPLQFAAQASFKGMQ